MMDDYRPPLPRNAKCLAVVLSLLILVMNFSAPIIRVLQNDLEGEYEHPYGVHLVHENSAELRIRWVSQQHHLAANQFLIPKVQYRLKTNRRYKTVYGISRYHQKQTENEVGLLNLEPGTTYVFRIVHFPRRLYEFTTFPKDISEVDIIFCSNGLTRNSVSNLNEMKSKKIVFFAGTIGSKTWESKEEIKACSITGNDVTRYTAGKIFPPYAVFPNKGPSAQNPSLISREKYSYNIGNARFISFHVDADNTEIEDRTLRWLMSQLDTANSQRDSVPWLIVFLTQPIYCTQTLPHQKMSEASISILSYIFHLSKVDLVIQQGCGAYERSYPLYLGRVATENKQNVDWAPTYVTLPQPKSAGHMDTVTASFLPSSQYPKWLAHRSTLPGSVILLRIINNTHILMRQKSGTDERILDKLSIVGMPTRHVGHTFSRRGIMFGFSGSARNFASGVSSIYVFFICLTVMVSLLIFSQRTILVPGIRPGTSLAKE